ncbi:hypothetical protein BASA81_005782 [Batrachochytrium salamandrivorans]|nr:hypothetical protein BASA81_005782 [Batrachochytrium salamandrivorans]
MILGKRGGTLRKKKKEMVTVGSDLSASSAASASTPRSVESIFGSRSALFSPPVIDAAQFFPSAASSSSHVTENPTYGGGRVNAAPRPTSDFSLEI